MTRLPLLALAAALAGCASLPPAPGAPVTMPAAYDNAPVASEAAAPIDAAWWKTFGDPNLDGLIAEAMTDNTDIAIGVATVRAARGSLRSARASLFPTLGASASASSNDDTGLDTFTSSGRLSTAYELDLFGGRAAERGAATERLDAANFDLAALQLTVQSDVAFSYFSVLALRERLATARANLALSERLYTIVDRRYEAGGVSGFDLAAQEAAIANARARLPQLERDLESTETALAILLGRVPQGFGAPNGDLLAAQAPAIDHGLPAELLIRRPDLRAAEARLSAAGADVAVARAAFLPSVDLGAALATTGATLGGDLLTTLTGSLAAPLFSGGTLEGSLERAKAGEDQSLAQYRRATLDALRDVDVSLKGVSTSRERERAIAAAYAASERSLRIAEARYRSGAEDLTTLLNAQSTFFDASDALTQARLDRLSAAIDLYAALGGGWPGGGEARAM
ncbi:MAG: efflux transporter outer membrane subunit [Alphaproteobacteria bacterium]|nr:efflux transporter outer membrane subunit [Alphaproteobacteria bacterium]